MKGYVTNIEDDTLESKDFRRVLYTGKNSQLVLMSLRPKEEIGEETHTLDQSIRVEAGSGVALHQGERAGQSARIEIPLLQKAIDVAELFGGQADRFGAIGHGGGSQMRDWRSGSRMKM